jgi:hypothetical protein
MEEIIPLERRHPNGTRVAILNDKYVGRVVAGPCLIIGTWDELYTKNMYTLRSETEPEIEYYANHKQLIPWNENFVVGAFVPEHQPRLVREGLYRPGDSVTLQIGNARQNVKITGGPYATGHIAYEVDKRTSANPRSIYDKYKVYRQDFLSHDALLERGPIAKRRAKLAANVAHAGRVPAMHTMLANKIGSINFRDAPPPPKSWYRQAANAVSRGMNRGVEVLSERLYPFYLENNNNNAENHAEAAGAAAAGPLFPPMRHLPNSVASKIANFLVEPQAAARAKVRNITRNIPRGERSGIQLKGGRRHTLRRHR